MPRMYLSTAEFQSTPLAQGPQVAGMLASLPAGALEQILAKASQKADSFCQRRLGAPITTQIIGGNVQASSTTLTVESTLMLDNREENAVIINPGGSPTETVLIRPGGVQLLSPYAPYPGTIALDVPLAHGYANNTHVQFCYREVSEAGSASMSDPYTEALETQTAQLALAHLPPTRNTLTRTIFLNNAPIISISEIEHAFSFTNQFNTIDLTIESIVPTQAWFRMNVGAVIMREGLMRVTYTGGFTVVPEDVRLATTYYAALELMMYINPFGLVEERMGKRTLRWQPFQGKHQLELQAESILKKYKRIV